MTKSDIKIRDMKQVIVDTEGKTDLVSKWARKGVKSEAAMDMSYLTRRVKSLRDSVPLPKMKIYIAEELIKELKQIVDCDE